MIYKCRYKCNNIHICFVSNSYTQINVLVRQFTKPDWFRSRFPETCSTKPLSRSLVFDDNRFDGPDCRDLISSVPESHFPVVTNRTTDKRRHVGCCDTVRLSKLASSCSVRGSVRWWFIFRHNPHTHTHTRTLPSQFSQARLNLCDRARALVRG